MNHLRYVLEKAKMTRGGHQPRSYPHTPTKGEYIAVRPNLAMPGYLTIHGVGPRGGIDYEHAILHTNQWVTMRDVICVQDSAATTAAFGGDPQHPMASVLGRFMGTGIDGPPHDWERVRYDPEGTDPQFRDDTETPICNADHAMLKWKELYCTGMVYGRTGTQ